MAPDEGHRYVLELGRIDAALEPVRPCVVCDQNRNLNGLVLVSICFGELRSQERDELRDGVATRKALVSQPTLYD